MTPTQRGNTLVIPHKDWRTFLVWSPLTGAVKEVSVVGGAPPEQTNAAYGRFMYHAARDVFVLINSTREPIYAIKLET